MWRKVAGVAAPMSMQRKGCLWMLTSTSCPVMPWQLIYLSLGGCIRGEVYESFVVCMLYASWLLVDVPHSDTSPDIAAFVSH